MTSGNERPRIFELKNWKEGKCAPCDIVRGSAAVSGSFVYCSTTGSKAVCAYNRESCTWSTLPDCPQHFFALVMVNETLTAVGGFRGISPTRALQSLVADGANSKKWEEKLPPMPTKRGRVAALCEGKHLIVVGGQIAVVGGRLGPGVRIPTSSPDHDESGYVKNVEMLDTESEQWYTLASLPTATTDLSISLCGGYLYLLGGWSCRDRTKRVLTSHLKTLLKTATISLSSSPVPAHACASLDVWQGVADVPTYACTSTVLFNTVLVAIGGFDNKETLTDEIYSYEPLDNSWHVVGHLLNARYQAVVATLPGNKVFVVGGYDNDYRSTNLTEIGSV